MQNEWIAAQGRFDIEEAKAKIVALLRQGIRLRLDDLLAGTAENDQDFITCRIWVLKSSLPRDKEGTQHLIQFEG